MSDILLKNGTYTVAADKMEVTFTAAEDILFPFRGTVVIPEVGGTDPVFPVGSHDWLFYSLKYPEGSASKRKFLTLRNMDNEAITISGDALLLIADDKSILDNLNFDKLFTDIGKFYAEVFKENITNSVYPKYLLFEFASGVSALPSSAKPTSRKKGFSLNTGTDGEPGLVAIRTALSNSFAGKIRAFDQAGRQTEAYSALRNIGVDKSIASSPIIPGTSIKVQFVDIHGSVLKHDAFPLNKLILSPTLTGQADFDTNKYYNLAFTGSERKFKLRLKKQPDTLVGKDKEHFYYFHYAAIWPGNNFKFKQIESHTTDLEIDLIKGFTPSATNIQPTFLRICLFHPEMEFQNTVGGKIELKSKLSLQEVKPVKWLEFEDNKMRFFSEKNNIKIFNNGQDFFKDIHKSITALKKDDEWYQVNWKCSPLLHMLGSMKLRNIKPNDLDGSSINTQITTAMGTSTLVSLEGTTDKVMLIPSLVNSGSVFSDDFAYQIDINPSASLLAKKLTTGIIRKTSPYSMIISLDSATGNTLFSQNITAYWKNSLKEVTDTTLTDAVNGRTITTLTQVDFPTSFSLTVNDNTDPYKLQIKRTATLVNIRTAIGEPTAALILWVLNPKAGGSYFIPIAPPTSSDSSSDVVLTDASLYADDSDESLAINALISNYTATDALYFSIISNPTSDTDAFLSLLKTKIKKHTFETLAFKTGNIPLHEQEIGGLYRTSIAKEVKVKAIFWDQVIGEIGGIPDTGLGNNESISQIVNNVIDSKRGFAFRDRSARSFGSWHQKSTFILQEKSDGGGSDPYKVLSGYLGGIDLAEGRWDSDFHLSKDPERQGGQWLDVQMKLEGEAVWDLLNNFRHRWKAMETITSSTHLTHCRPVLDSSELNASFAASLSNSHDISTKKIKISGDKAFLQINRTIPSLSCYSDPAVIANTGIDIPSSTGERGSLASYTKAINNAKRFIVINDQYFYSLELALLLHDRLKAVDGPDFLVLVLPKELGESKYIDPHFYKLRQKAIHTLYYGAADSSSGVTSKCGKIAANPNTTPSIKSKVVILHPVNRAGKKTYVHSKHLIVDDVWMSIGSANLNSRSLTYDMEINAAIVAQKLMQGATNMVKTQRVEVFQKLLGLPKAYTALMKEPYAAFKILKAIETSGAGNKLHPRNIMSKKLAPDYIKKVGEAPFDAEVDIVAILDYNDTSFNFITCNILDLDGRASDPDRVGFIAGGAGFGKVIASAKAVISFNFSTALKNNVIAAIGLGEKVELNITLMIIDPDGNQGPLLAGNYELIEDIAVPGNIALKDLAASQVTVAISTLEVYRIGINLNNITSSTDMGIGSVDFNPASASPPITHGSTRNQVVNVNVI